MNAKECIRGRRSIRHYKDTPVPHEVLEEIIADAAYAPFNAKTVSTAPMLIVQTFIKNRSGYERDGSFTTDRGEGWQMYDAGIAAQTLCLSAHDHGLGTVIMGIFHRRELEKYLNIPEDQEIAALIALGYPDEEPKAPRRKDVETLLSYAD